MEIIAKLFRAFFLLSTLLSLALAWLYRDQIGGLIGLSGSPAAATDGGSSPQAGGSAPQNTGQLAVLISAAAPDNAKAQMAAGALFLRQEKPEPAMQAFEKALSLDPQNADAHFQIGMILMRHEKLKEAETCFRDALRLKPDSIDARFGLAAVVQQTGMLSEAAALYQDIIRMDAQNAQAHNNLGIVYDAQGNKQEALRQFEKALELTPQDDLVRQNLEDTRREIQERQQMFSPPSPSPETTATAPETPAAAWEPVPAEPGDPTSTARTLVLTNGRRVSGSLSETTDDGVWLEVASGRVFFSNSEISEILSDRP